MPCYRHGSCGPYEMYSCSECPASDPAYLERDKKKPNATTFLSDLPARVLEKQARVESTPRGANVVTADEIFENIMDEPIKNAAGITARVIGIYQKSADRESVEALFAELTGTTWVQYLKMSEAALDKALASARKENDAMSEPTNGIDPVVLQKINRRKGFPVPFHQLATWQHWKYGYRDNGVLWTEREVHTGLAGIPADAEEIWSVEPPAIPEDVRAKIKMNRGFSVPEDRLATWPHWRYGYYGNGGDDWKSYDTHAGLADVPDCAEEIYPLEAPKS